ncbi:MAG: caspase family protein [Desulfobacterales bacterium]
MMYTKTKYFYTLVAVIGLTFAVASESAAKTKTYQWHDFTRPFTERLILGTAEVEVALPQTLIQQYKKVTLVIRQSGLRGNYAGIIRGGTLRVNDQSVWSTYNFGRGKRPEGTIRLNVKTKHLRHGPNTLKFSAYYSGTMAGDFSYKIYALRFELPDGKSLVALTDKKPRKIPHDKPAPIKPKDTKPPKIRILSHDTSRAINVLGKNKKIRIRGKATDTSGIAEILVNHKDAVFDKAGNFEADVYLRLGRNDIVVSAMDPAENRAVKRFTILREAAVTQPRKETARAAAGKFYALVIGNNAYKHLRDLETAIRDAEAIDNILKIKYGFSTELLVDAKRNDILDAINSFRKILKADDNFLIYYAGHGVFDKSANKAYWLPADAQRDNDTNWIIVDTITSNIKRISSRHIVIVSDSCYSGTFTRRGVTDLDSARKRSRYLQKMRAKKSRTLLASGGNEPVSDIGGQGHSVFAKAFLSGLKNIELKEFTAEELYYKHIKEMVAGSSNQTPEYNIIRNSGHEGGDFLFVKRHSP